MAVASLEQKIALAALAYGQMDASELLDAIAYQERLLADPCASDEARVIAARCLEVCRGLVRGLLRWRGGRFESVTYGALKRLYG